MTSSPRHLAQPSFVGRAAELAAFGRALEWAKSWRGDFVLIEAQSGGGKTRLLEELGIASARAGAWVLRGRGDERIAQRPLFALEGIIHQILHEAERNEALARGLRERLLAEREAICAALPQLGPLLGPGPARALGPEAHGEERTLRALAALFQALGEPRRPVVLLLDDCQWLDELTLKLLSRLRAAREEAKADSHVLVVLAFRTEDLPQGHPLLQLEPLLRLLLGPLGTAEIRALLESMAGALPEEALAQIAQKAQGNPFAAIALLHGAHEEGQLSAGAPLHLGEGAADLVRARVLRLPPDSARLLSAGAVLGSEFDFGLASALVDQTPAQAQAALEAARARLMVLADGDRISFAHGKLREAVLERLTRAERQALHRRAAQAIAARAQGDDRDFELAFHLDAAGDLAEALPAALRAAERARARHALEIAERNYRIAERGAGAAPAHTRRQIAEGLGDVLMLRGRYDEAEGKLVQARALAQGAQGRAALEGKLGELAFRRGDLGTATGSLERALEALGHVVPRSRPLFTLACLWEVLVQLCHLALPWLLLERREQSPRAQPDLLSARLFGRLSYAYYYTRFPLAPLWAHLRELNLAERYRPTPELAAAFAKHALVLLWFPWLVARGLAYAQRALALYQRLGDSWGEGHTCFLAGAGLANVARYAEGLELLGEGRQLLERTGDRWEENASLANASICHYWLGDLARAAAEAERALGVARAIGDAHAVGISAKIWALASGGRIPEGLVEHALLAAGPDALTRSGLLVAEATRLLRERQAKAAAATLRDADRALREAGVKVDFVITATTQLVTALRVAGELDAATVASRRALRLGRRFPNHLCHALREAGLLAAHARDGKRARRLLDQAVVAADSLEQRYEAAQARLARARAAALLGWPEAAAEEKSARAALDAVGIDFALGGPVE